MTTLHGDGRLEILPGNYITESGLDLPCPLDISNSGNVAIIKQLAKKTPSLVEQIELNLENYLYFFKDDSWRTLYAGGFIKVGKNIYNFFYLLSISAILSKLKDHEGFDKLLTGFQNPSSISSTIFEITMAGWCNERKISRSFVFSPPVTIGNKIKYPEFLWETTIGKIYCECKSANIIGTNIQQRFNRLFDEVKKSYKKANVSWPAPHRVDIDITGSAKNKVEERINSAIQKLASLYKQCSDSTGLKVQEGEVLVRFENKLIQPNKTNVLSAYEVIVETSPTEISFSNARYSLWMDVGKHWELAAKGLFHKAKKQLPLEEPAMIFIQVPSKIDTPINKITALLETGAHTPPIYWVGIVFPEELKTVWIKGQPFDHRILE